MIYKLQLHMKSICVLNVKINVVNIGKFDLWLLMRGVIQFVIRRTCEQFNCILLLIKVEFAIFECLRTYIVSIGDC